MAEDAGGLRGSTASATPSENRMIFHSSSSSSLPHVLGSVSGAVSRIWSHRSPGLGAGKKLARQKKGRPSRASQGIRMSFPEVSVQDALTFALEGSQLVEPPGRGWWPWRSRGGGARCVCSVDARGQVLERVYAGPGEQGLVRKSFLVDVLDVHPVVVSDESSLDVPLQEFFVVTASQKLKFRAASRHEVKYWVTALQHLMNHRLQHATVGSQLMQFARCQFQKADVNGDGSLVLSEVQTLLRSLNVVQGPHQLSETFIKFDVDGNGAITEDEFAELFRVMMVKRPLATYFEKYTAPDDHGERVMPWHCLCQFLAEVQGEHHASEEQIVEELSGFGEPLLTSGRGALTEVGFGAFMCSAKNSILHPAMACLHQDMTRPLSCYWISCSHNTYLEDFQIAGTASVEQYLQVIRQGCRCVEIDCWDGPNGNPVVTHGYTLTNKISFEEVVLALRDHGFDHSPFPLILSLEMRCSSEQVARVGQILTSTFGDALLRHSPDGHRGKPLTSPKDAMHKVIVKAKLVGGGSTHNVEESDEEPAAAQGGTVGGGDDASPPALSGTGSVSCSAGPGRSGEAPSPTTSFSSGSMQASTPASVACAQAGRRRALLAHGLAEFNQCIYLVAKKIGSLDEEREPCNIASFSDAKLHKMMKMHGANLNAHHRDHLTRVYPPGHRVASSNMSPLPHWLRGAQLVALNYQCMDRPMVLHEGMFREQNGGFGYVLKPPSVLDGVGGPSGDGRVTTLKLHVLSAHFLPKPKGDDALESINPSVTISIHGVEVDCTQFKTSCVKNDGFAPEWHQEFTFHVTWEDVAIVAFEVYHHVLAAQWPTAARPGFAADGRKFVAAAAFPVRGLRAGIRWVPLWDSLRQPIQNCGLLVEVTMSRASGEGADRRRTHLETSPNTTHGATLREAPQRGQSADCVDSIHLQQQGPLRGVGVEEAPRGGLPSALDDVRHSKGELVQPMHWAASPSEAQETQSHSCIVVDVVEEAAHSLPICCQCNASAQRPQALLLLPVVQADECLAI